MKKIVMTLVLCAAVSGIVYADGNAFTPLNFNDTSYSGNTSKYITSTNSMQDEATGSGNIQNAILQVENAQTNLRNELQNLQTKFTDIDSQYKLIRAERKTVKQQIKEKTKQIKDNDKAKEILKNNMLK